MTNPIWLRGEWISSSDKKKTIFWQSSSEKYFRLVQNISWISNNGPNLDILNVKDEVNFEIINLFSIENDDLLESSFRETEHFSENTFCENLIKITLMESK